MRTVRCHIEYAEPNTSCYEQAGGERHLFCLWHDGIIGYIFSRPAFDLAALVSLHGDGTYLSEALEAIGIPSIRGSSRRGGAAALRQMLETARDRHIAIATDGPVGPRREVKEGIISLASQTGRAIIPAGYAACSALRPVGRWSDLTIPLELTHAYMCVGGRIWVPPGLDRDQLEPYRRKVQAAMDALQAEADRRAGDDSTARWARITPRRKRRRKAKARQRQAA